nr:uncharacterized protein LOC113704793 [Coffea arabica]
MGNRNQRNKKEEGMTMNTDMQLDATGDLEKILDRIPVTITEQMNKELSKKVEEKEIKTAFFSMDPNKALGSDDMSPLFFQRFWSIIKQDLVNAIQGFFYHSVILKAINHTVISLIPKIDWPIEVNQYRPISLCQVVYKAKAKILVSRMQPFLSRCISKNRSAFVSGRQILDNVILSHELLHFLKNKRHGREGYMAVKLNMSKAYDRVEWKCLKAIMEKMGFCSTWISWISSCISSVTYSFKVNGEHNEYITPSRGVRQGDPLSPYLFLLCPEGFSNLLQKAKHEKELTAVKVSRKVPTITHLFFTDDSLVFCKAKVQEAGKLMKVLKVYEEAMGQLINLEKSSVFFSKNTDQIVRNEFCQAVRSIQQVGQGKYLGLPMIITRSKKQVFGFIKNSIDKKLQDWKNKLLSQARNEIMLKAVALAMLTYTMSCFRLHTQLCREINSKMADYWWRDTEGKNKIHWISWKKITQTREAGGMGFKDMQISNKTLLAKQLLFNCKVPKNAFWIWKSISAVRKELQQGTTRKIGNGRDTRIWEVNWIPDRPHGKPTLAKPQGCQLNLFSNLISNNKWNRVLVLKTCSSQDAERILSIPISVTGKEDSYYWVHSQNGQYMVQSGYKTWIKEKNQVNSAVREKAGRSYEGTISKVWKSLWKQNVSQKLKVFMWKSLHGALPVRELIYRRTKQGNPMRAGCGEREETLEHMMLQCKKAKEIWKMTPVQWDGLEHLYDCFLKWWITIMEAQQSRDDAKQIWKAKNDREFNQKEREPHKIVEKAIKDWVEFEEANKGKEPRKITQETEVQHRTNQNHNEGVRKMLLKIHTQQDKRQSVVGIGITAANNLGQLQAAWALRERMLDDPLQDQAKTVKPALLKAANQGWRHIKVELDNRRLMEYIMESRHNNWRVATLVEDI